MSETRNQIPQPYQQQPEEKPKKPWYKKWWIWAIAAMFVIGGIATAGDSGDKDEEALVVEEAQSLGEAPDQVGELLSVAIANLELEDYAVDYVSDDGSNIKKKQEGDWTVLEQKQNGDEVLLTVGKVEEEKEETTQEATTGGLTGLYAQTACDRAAEQMFPYGVKMHWVVGKLAEEYRPDTDDWYLKVTATVTNEYGAQMKGVNVECYVTGSNEKPEIVDFVYY